MGRGRPAAGVQRAAHIKEGGEAAPNSNRKKSKDKHFLTHKGTRTNAHAHHEHPLWHKIAKKESLHKRTSETERHNV